MSRRNRYIRRGVTPADIGVRGRRAPRAKGPSHRGSAPPLSPRVPGAPTHPRRRPRAGIRRAGALLSASIPSSVLCLTGRMIHVPSPFASVSSPRACTGIRPGGHPRESSSARGDNMKPPCSQELWRGALFWHLEGLRIFSQRSHPHDRVPRRKDRLRFADHRVDYPELPDVSQDHRELLAAHPMDDDLLADPRLGHAGPRP
jgi:hypothetical protein